MSNQSTAWLLEELGRLNDDAERLLEAWLATDDERLGKGSIRSLHAGCKSCGSLAEP